MINYKKVFKRNQKGIQPYKKFKMSEIFKVILGYRKVNVITTDAHGKEIRGNNMVYGDFKDRTNLHGMLIGAFVCIVILALIFACQETNKDRIKAEGYKQMESALPIEEGVKNNG